MFRTINDPADVVGCDPAARVAGVARGVGAGGCAAGRSGVLRAVRRVFRCPDRPSVEPDGDLSAVDVSEVPVPAGLRVVVSGGVRFDFLAAVLPDPVRYPGPAPDHVDEDHQPMRRRRGHRAQRGAAGKGRRGQAAAHRQGPRRHHRHSRRGVLSDRFGSAGQGNRGYRRAVGRRRSSDSSPLR